MTLKICKVRENAIIPTRATDKSAGLDLYASIEDPLLLKSGETKLIPTGISIALPEGYAGLVFARSGLGVKHGLAPANAVGVIDEDYRGEIFIGLHNFSDTDYTISVQERIAQLVLMPVLCSEVSIVSSLDETVRGSDGFGSSGRE